MPGVFQDGWHLALLCARLQAISEAGCGRQMWASPPRSSKSTVIDVFWPAWTWLQDDRYDALLGRWVQFLHITHRDDLAVRDSQRCRRLIKSPWYQNLCGGSIRVLPDADQSAYFAIEGGGSRRAFGIRADITGHDSDIQSVGDPFDVQGVLSPVERARAEFVFDEVLPSRFNHPTRNALVLAAQRTHVSDLHAHVLDSPDWQRGIWRYDCIPGIREADHPHGSDGDSRAPGEVYWPERFTAASLLDLVKTQHAKAAQIQQNPSKRGAGIFRAANWQIAAEAPAGLRKVRYWDKAATPEGVAPDADYTAGALGARDEAGRFWLLDMQRGRWSSAQVENRIKFVAQELDSHDTQIWIEEEPGAAGKDVVSYYQRRVLPGFSVRGDRASGSPLVRVDPFVAAAEAGNVWLVRAAWNRDFFDECDIFTGQGDTHDDQVIAAACCFKRAMTGVYGPLIW